jgi:hypothetical protein
MTGSDPHGVRYIYCTKESHQTLTRLLHEQTPLIVFLHSQHGSKRLSFQRADHIVFLDYRLHAHARSVIHQGMRICICVCVQNTCIQVCVCVCVCVYEYLCICVLMHVYKMSLHMQAACTGKTHAHPDAQVENVCQNITHICSLSMHCVHAYPRTCNKGI